MMMKTCICIAGMPASGKTTAALRLSEKLGIAMLSKDEIKEKLFDRIGFQSRQEKVQLGLAAMEILYYAAERCLAAGESVILENNFEDLSRPGLQALQERTGCRILGAVLNRVDMAGSGYYHRYYGKYSKYTKYYENEPAK